MYTVNDYTDSIADCLDCIESIEIYNEGKKTLFISDNKYFAKTVANLKNVFNNARLMPAFGVSLHYETIKAIKLGKWIKINFSKELTKNDLSFTSLLFEITTTQGVNLIREYSGKYEGRCLYVDFDKEIDLMKELF